MTKEYSLIYTRVASVKQVKEGSSLAGQEQHCVKFSDEKGYVHEKTFTDEGISGSAVNRPAMKQMLQYIDANPNKKYVVIVDDTNRIARNFAFLLAVKKEVGS